MKSEVYSFKEKKDTIRVYRVDDFDEAVKIYATEREKPVTEKEYKTFSKSMDHYRCWGFSVITDGDSDIYFTKYDDVNHMNLVSTIVHELHHIRNKHTHTRVYEMEMYARQAAEIARMAYEIASKI